MALHANWQDATPPSGLSDGAVVLTAPEPLAASSRVEWYSAAVRTRASHYTGATTGRAKLFASSIYRTKFADGAWNIINSNGGLVHGPITATLQPNQAIGYNTDTLPGFPNLFEGSAIASAMNGAQALIVIGNLIYTTSAPGGDRAAVYEGVGF